MAMLPFMAVRRLTRLNCLGRAPAAWALRAPGLRAVGSEAQVLVEEVEAAVASGRPIRKDSPLYARLHEEVDRLRTDNDQIIASVDNLNNSRASLVAESSSSVVEIQAGGAKDVSTMAETLEKIEELDHEMGKLRSQQIQNYLNIGALKRQRVTVQKNEEVMELVSQVEESLAKGEAVEEDSPLIVSLEDATRRLREEFDSFAKSILQAKKELENVVSRTRSLELSLRARRGKADHEGDTLRANLISGLYEARRKNAQLTRYRIQQALNVKLVSVLERARETCRVHAKVQALIASGDKEQMEVQITNLLREIATAQKTAAELEQRKEMHHKEVNEVTSKLREFEDKVTPETGKLREELIAALREEEFCIARLAVLRKVQAQDVKFLARLRQALA